MMLRTFGTLGRKYPGGAFLDDTFGHDDSHLRRWLDSGQLSAFRGHLAWTNHQPVAASSLIPRARYFDALAAEYPAISFYASLVCEHPMTSQQSSALNAELRPYMPHIKGITDSGTRGTDPDAIREVHGPHMSAPFASLDGDSACDVDVEKFKTHGLYYALLWSREFNGRLEHDNSDPLHRTNFPSQDQFNLIARLSFPCPPPIEPPAGMTKTWGFPSAPRIWKTSAENYGGCHGRDCRPVWITNTKLNKIKILAANGHDLGWMNYGGAFGHGQHRYYLGQGSGQTAFELGQQAETVAGSEWVFLQEGSNCFQVNAYRRAGAFHA